MKNTDVSAPLGIATTNTFACKDRNTLVLLTHQVEVVCCDALLYSKHTNHPLFVWFVCFGLLHC